MTMFATSSVVASRGSSWWAMQFHHVSLRVIEQEIRCLGPALDRRGDLFGYDRANDDGSAGGGCAPLSHAPCPC
jgi:hypothetical protein